MLHIFRLNHGNYGTTGDTSLVWQNSKVHHVLPTHPSTCKYICIERVSRSNNGDNNRMVQKNEKEKIGDVQELLQHTVVGVWAKITLSQDDLNAWPQSGDILDLDVIPQITTTLNEKEDSVESSNEFNHSNILGDLLGDGDNLGPAPLQNTTVSTDTFEVNADVLNTSTTGINDANFAINQF